MRQTERQTDRQTNVHFQLSRLKPCTEPVGRFPLQQCVVEKKENFSIALENKKTHALSSHMCLDGRKCARLIIPVRVRVKTKFTFSYNILLTH
jgi:hypothetical protein